MKTSKSLASAVAAVALVGGIGFAYAQTSSSGATTSPGSVAPDTSSSMQNKPATSSDSGMTSRGNAATDSGTATGATGSGSTMGAGSNSSNNADTTGFRAERPARADRN
jgi:hypothetical protein